MPFSRPTLQVLQSQAAADISSSVAGADPLLRFANLGIIGVALARLINLVYGYLDWVAQNAVPFTATAEFLEGWAGLIGVTRLPATAAGGQVTFTGTNGTDVPAGTPVVRGDGTQYTTNADVVVSAGSAVVTVTAAVSAAAGNAASGTVMTLGSAIVGVQSAGSATSPLTGGADLETDAAFRTRMLAQYAAPPQGGDKADYVSWATQVAGVTRAWVNPNGFGAGTVVVYTMLDAAEAPFNGFPQGVNGVAAAEPRDTPATGDQLAVANYIYGVQPVTALVYSEAPTATPVAFTISNLGGNNTGPIQAAIAAALAAMLVQIGQVGGTVNPATGAAWPPVDPSDWYAALEAIPGLTKFSVPIPAAPITPTTGQLFTVGALTFNS